MAEFVDNMQMRLKSSGHGLVTFALRLFTGVVMGLTLALIVHEIFGIAPGKGTVSFAFMIVAMTAAFLRISKKWSLISVLIFDLVLVLLGTVLRFYIIVAPNT